MIGPGDSFRDDLGIKIREMFEEGAAEALTRRPLSVGALRVAERAGTTIEVAPTTSP